MNALKRLWHRLGSPRWFYEISGPWAVGALIIGLVGIAVGLVWGLAIAPPDYLQGNSFRIMYLHVPFAILSQSCYITMGLAGAVLLIWRMKLADMVVAAAAPIGVVFCSVALLTGSIWGRPTWGTWWVWDARTTSTLVLLFLYFGVIALRQAIPREETAGRAAAILAVVGVIDIPIIKYSVDWWLTLHQTSTFKLTSAPSMPPEMYLPLLVGVLGFYAFFFGVLLFARRQRGARARAAHAVGRRSGAESGVVSFDSWHDFLYMGGHYPFVWSSYAIGVLGIVITLVRPLRARRRFLCRAGTAVAPTIQCEPGEQSIEQLIEERGESQCIRFVVIG